MGKIEQNPKNYTFSDDAVLLQKIAENGSLEDNFQNWDAFFGDLKNAIIIVDKEFKIVYLNNIASVLNFDGNGERGSMVMDFVKRILYRNTLISFYESLMNKESIIIDEGFSLLRIEKLILNPIGQDGFVIKFFLDELYTVSVANLFRYFPGMPIGYIGFDLIGNKGISIRFVSDNFSSLFPSLDVESIISDPIYFSQFMHPEDHIDFIGQLRNINSGQNIFSFEFRMMIDENEGRWYRMISSRFSEKSEKNFWLAYVEDIDEKIKANREKEILVHETLDDERHRMSMELHDGLGQNLVALNLYLSALSGMSDNNITDTCKKLTIDSIQLMKSMCYNLAPPDLDKGLIYALDVFFSKANEHSNVISYRFKSKNIQLKQISQDRAYHIFRIIQEFVTNAQKYAECSEICCEIGMREQHAVLMIYDNGKGFEQEKTEGGFGLKNMIKRSKLAKAEIEFKSSPGEGTLLILEF